MPSRRFHHKSSTGCHECKQQRVKCDENKPSCNRCIRQERSCSYTRQPVVTTADAPSPGTPSASSTSQGYQLSSNSSSSIVTASPAASADTSDGFNTLVASPSNSSHLQDLELLHNWTLEAASSFTQEMSLKDVWHNQVVRQALKYPFLMHAIFSFSALNLVSRLSQDLAPNRDAWLKRSAHDYGLALTLARPELENINPHNCHAVFAFSSIVAIYRLALPGVSGDYGEGGVLQHTLQTFHLLRGILAVLKVAYPWVKAGPMGAAMQDIDDFEPRPIEPTVKQSLEALEMRITRQVSSREGRMAYFEAIQRMRLYFSHPGNPDNKSNKSNNDSNGGGAASSNGTSNVATPSTSEASTSSPRPAAASSSSLSSSSSFPPLPSAQPRPGSKGNSTAAQSAAAWPVLLQAEYMDDLSERRPLALAILAYYAVILEEQRHTWWMVDQAKRLLIAVMQELEPLGQEWLDLLQCAQQRVRPENLYSILHFKVPKSLEMQEGDMIG